VAVCYLDGEDLNGWLVRQGWALHYRLNSEGPYATDEAAARTAKRGIWAGKFVKPWEWRQSQATTKKRTTESESASKACRIKGNITSRGERIYHVPGGQFYSQTRIAPSKGERWFCTEVDAQAAGVEAIKALINAVDLGCGRIRIPEARPEPRPVRS
jgi:hypothetical protein